MADKTNPSGRTTTSTGVPSARFSPPEARHTGPAASLTSPRPIHAPSSTLARPMNVATKRVAGSS